MPDYKHIRSLAVASMLAVFNENLQRAEEALIDTDARSHIEGLRLLHGERLSMTRAIERLMVATILKCPACKYEELIET